MLIAFVLMASASPAYAPAPVPKTTIPLKLLAWESTKHTLTISRYGRPMILKVSKDFDITINGARGYALYDLDDINLRHVPCLTVKLDDQGVVRSMDIKLKLAKGEVLLRPGEGADRRALRWAQENEREMREQLRRWTGGKP